MMSIRDEPERTQTRQYYIRTTFTHLESLHNKHGQAPHYYRQVFHHTACTTFACPEDLKNEHRKAPY